MSCASCVIIIISRWVHGGLLRSVIPASHSSVSHADEHRQKHSTTRRKEKRRRREGRGRSEVESRSLSDMRRNQRQSNSLDCGKRSFAPSQAVRASVIQHLQRGISSLLNFATARRLPLLRGTTTRVIFPCLLLDPPRHLP